MKSAIRARFHEEDLVPALIFIALATFACLTPAQNDTWWHLRSGQQMWQTGSFLFSEPFSYTANGSELHNHWWLSQLSFYGVYRLGGPFLLTVFAGACALAAVVASWRLMRGPWELRVGLLTWLVVVTAAEWAIRPQVISLVLLMLMVHLVARDRLMWLPVVCAVWANAHALVIFGVAVSGAVALEAMIWSRSDRNRALAIAVASAAAPLLSPLGWSYWPQIVATVTASRELQIQEYQPPIGTAAVLFWSGVAALILLLVRPRTRFADRPRVDRVLTIAAAGLAIAAATASRNMAFFAVVTAPALSRLWPAASAVRRPARPASAAAWGIAAAAALSAVAIVVVQWRGDAERLGWAPMTAETVQAVKRCPDPIFHHLKDGGFLMWALPERRVFVDSRMEAYPVPLLRRSRMADVNGIYEDLFADYGIRCAVTATGSVLSQRLARDPVMRVIHADAQHTVFARFRDQTSVATRMDIEGVLR